MNDKEKLNPAVWVMIGIMLVGFLSIGYQIVLKNVFVDMLHIKKEWIDKSITSLEGRSIYSPEKLDIDWENLYPFPEKLNYPQEEIMHNVTESTDNGSIIDRIYFQLDKYSSNWFMFTEQCELMSKSFQKALGMNIVVDGYGKMVFELPDGRYMAERPYKSTRKESNNVISLSNNLKDMGIDFLYVVVPSPVDPSDEKAIIAEGYQEYSNQMADELTAQLINEQINVLDLRKELKEKGVSWEDIFFRTDHHGLPKFGLLGAGIIADNIDNIYGINTDKQYFDISNYKIIAEKNVYMGGYGQSLTGAYTKGDDMEVWSPIFETDIEKKVLDLGLDMSGTFDDVMYDMTVWPSYNIWNHGIDAIKTYHNNDSVMSLKILVLSDSYSDVIMPFLVCAYSDIEEIDLRIFTGSLETYIQQNKPDIVITIYSAYDLNSGSENELYNFN